MMEQVLREINDKVVARTKKDRILSLFSAGITDIETISAIAGARPSYVGSVLQREGLIDNYFDLYTSTGLPMNVYSKYFSGKLGFKDVEAAERGVGVLEIAYRHFEQTSDRAGQHHALEMALTMLDRARWTGKLAEAEVYRRWLMHKLSTPLVENVMAMALAADETKPEVEEAEFKKAA